MALVTIADIRAQGLTAGQASDPTVQAAIDLVTQYVEALTGRWFEARVFTEGNPLVLDGSGTDVLQLPVPLISLSKVLEGGSEVALADLGYQLVTAGTRPDFRHRARLVKKSVLGATIIGSGYSRRAWLRRRDNVAIVGTLGFVEPDGASPPPVLKRAAMRMVLRDYRPLTDPEAAVGTARKMSETVTGWSYTLGGIVASLGPTGDPEIDNPIALYTRRGGGHTGSFV